MGTWTWSAEGEYVWQWFGPGYRPDGLPVVTINFDESIDYNSERVDSDESKLPVHIFVLSGIGVLIILASIIIYGKRRRRASTD